jgi:MFS family permease
MLIVPGMLIGSAAMLWMLTLEPGTSYASGVLVVQLLFGLGAGMIMPVAINYATHGVDQGDSGVASASVNTAQQIGGSIGTALLNTIATSATVDYLASHGTTPATARQAAVEGFGAAGAWAAGILVVGALVVAVLMNTPRPENQAVIKDAEGAGDAGGAEPLLAHS